MTTASSDEAPGLALTVRTRRLRRFAGLALLSVLLGAACSQRLGPEAEVRLLLDEAIVAAGKKDIGRLRDMVSDQYTDSEGQDKRAVENLLRVHFLRNESLHFYSRIQSITLPRTDHAQAVLVVAMAGVPITGEEQLAGLRADLHRFELDLAREGRAWRVRHAAWRRADPGEWLRP